MRRTLLTAMSVLIAVVALACTGEVKTAGELTSTPSTSSLGGPTEIPTQVSQPTVAPTETPTPSPTATPTLTPTATPIPGPTSVLSSASFSIDAGSGSAPHTVEFSNTSEGYMTFVEWDFGDRTSSTDESPSHRYTIAGTYSVTLRISGPGGDNTTAMSNAITVKPGPAISLEIDPPTATLAVQEGTQFTAVARDEFGNVVPSRIVWSVTGIGGSITDGGVFTADTLAGSYPDTISASIVTDSGDMNVTASATVKPGPIFSAVVEPDEVTLDIGVSHQFTFQAFDAFDNEIEDIVAKWAVPLDVGEIDS